MKRLAVVFAAVFLFSSCGGMKEGTIINKEIEPANDYYAWIPIQTGSICTTTGGQYPMTSCIPIYTPFPFLMHDDEDYAIVLESCRNDDCKRGRRYLARDEYDRVDVGQFWSEKQRGEFVVENKDSRKRRAKESEMPEGHDV